METKDLPIVEPNMSQHGDMHTKILNNGIKILYENIKERRTNGCTITFVYNNKKVELDVRIISEEQLEPTGDSLHLDDIKQQEGE